jgi:multiple antibiotic resistance protein
MFEQFVKFFVVFFVVVEPVALAPMFASLTEGAAAPWKRRMAFKAVIVAAIILLVFAISGASFLSLMGISIEAFRIFGGLLLFLMALEMVFARESGTRTSHDEKLESRKRADISVFPLAFPLLAGPGALTTILLWFGPHPVTREPALFGGLLLAAFLVLALAWLSMRLSGNISRLLGVTGANVANRLLGVVLGALAVQFLIDGIHGAFGL